MSNKTLALFCTYKITPAIMSEFAKMQNCGVECVLGINNSNHIVKDDMCGGGGIIQTKSFYGIEAKCILLDLKVLQEANLYIFGENVGATLWNSTDYWAYIARKYFPDFDFYWQIDYDCFLNAPNYQEFFDFYKQESTDLIVSHFRKESKGSKWCWLANTQWAYTEDTYWYGCLFCIVRYSARLLDVLYPLRVKYKEKFEIADKPKQWLMCEFFVATETIKNGLSARNFAEDGHKIRIKPFDLNTERFFIKPDNKMYHCVKENLEEQLRAKERTITALNAQIKKLNAQTLFCFKLGVATHRIHNHLAYKLGAALILNSKSLWGYIRMPYVLSYIKESHRKEIADYEARVAKNPSLKLPKLESYPDYKEALREKQCFTYKLGEALMQADKDWYKGGYLRFYFKELPRLKKEFREKRR